MTVNEIIKEFEDQFSPIREKFEILKLLEGERKLDYYEIEHLALPSAEYNIIWHPGVYIFFGNGKPYRVGRHLSNSRLRVLQHLNIGTGNENAKVWDIENAPDREIILFNVKDKKDYHWVAAVEIYMEKILKQELQIPAKRQG